MALPLPTVPTTVYVAGVSEVKSADLNDFETFMAAVKAFVEEGAYFKRPSLANNAPIASFADRDGRVRHYVGPEGFLMGSAIQDSYIWRQQGASVGASSSGDLIADKIAGFADANCSISMTRGSLPAAKSNSAVLRLVLLNAAASNRVAITSGAVISPSGGMISNLDDASVVLETRVAVTAIGSNEVDLYVGLYGGVGTAGSIDAASEAHVMFTRKTGVANWQCQVGNGTAKDTPVDSGVAIVADQYFTLRVEYHGANTPLGVDNTTSAVARFFIDGVEVAEITTANIPAAATQTLDFFVCGDATATGPSSDFTAYVAASKMAWNEVLDGDIPA